MKYIPLSVGGPDWCSGVCPEMRLYFPSGVGVLRRDSRVSAFRRWSLYPCWFRVMSRLSVFLLEIFATAFLAVIVFLVVNVHDLWGECVVSMQMLRLCPGPAEDGCCVPGIQSLLFPGLAVWE